MAQLNLTGVLRACSWHMIGFRIRPGMCTANLKPPAARVTRKGWRIDVVRQGAVVVPQPFDQFACLPPRVAAGRVPPGVMFVEVPDEHPRGVAE